jgi:SAM-dependent methyltransferase
MQNFFSQRQGDGRWRSPSAERNAGPIVAVLKRTLPSAGLVLEIASGTGQHVAHFAQALPKLTWQPSDPDEAMRASIRRWVSAEHLGNVREPLDLDVSRTPWPPIRADAIVCINMIHVAPWAATTALFAGAANCVIDEGVLFLYGPYRRLGRHTAPSNAAFDSELRSTNPAWGVRDLEAVGAVAADAGFDLVETIEMPANNFSLVFHKRLVQNPTAEAADGV